MAKYGNPLRYEDDQEAGLEVDFNQLAKDAYYAIGDSNTQSEGKSFEMATTTRVNGMKEEWGSGVSTLIMIYNATGCTLKLDDMGSDSGKFWKYEPDPVVYNGEWTCFLHVKTAGTATGSCGWVGYKMHGDVGNIEGMGTMDDYYFVTAWDTPWSGSNTAWTGVQMGAGYEGLKAVYHTLADEGKERETKEESGFALRHSTSDASSPLLRVVATRPGLL